jgi:hypothetical protein
VIGDPRFRRRASVPRLAELARRPDQYQDWPAVRFAATQGHTTGCVTDEGMLAMISNAETVSFTLNPFLTWPTGLFDTGNAAVLVAGDQKRFPHFARPDRLAKHASLRPPGGGVDDPYRLDPL